ncbi:TPA: two-component system sensor histidine kinase CreC, partial [Aeromonas hydrophila]
YSLPRPDKGKSSGLGLSFATEVARQHGGRLTLANQPDGGVLAELWLPAG